MWKSWSHGWVLYDQVRKLVILDVIPFEKTFVFNCRAFTKPLVFPVWYIVILRIFTGEISFTHLRGKAGAETCLGRAGGCYRGAYIKFRCTVVPKWVNFQLVWTIQCAWPSTIRVALPERDGRVVELPRFEVLLDASQVPYMVSKNVSCGRNIMLASPTKYGPAFVSLYNQFCCKH